VDDTLFAEHRSAAVLPTSGGHARRHAVRRLPSGAGHRAPAGQPRPGLARLHGQTARADLPGAANDCRLCHTDQTCVTSTRTRSPPATTPSGTTAATASRPRWTATAASCATAPTRASLPRGEPAAQPQGRLVEHARDALPVLPHPRPERELLHVPQGTPSHALAPAHAHRASRTTRRWTAAPPRVTAPLPHVDNGDNCTFATTELFAESRFRHDDHRLPPSSRDARRRPGRAARARPAAARLRRRRQRRRARPSGPRRPARTDRHHADQFESPPGVDAEITSLSGNAPGSNFEPGDTITVQFTLLKDDGEAWDIDEMATARILVSGPTFNYQRVIAEQSDLASGRPPGEAACGRTPSRSRSPTYLPALQRHAGLRRGRRRADRPAAARRHLHRGHVHLLGLHRRRQSGFHDVGTRPPDFLFGSTTDARPARS
jgi:hypothetical protein